MDEARAHGIPIICVVDADKQTQREVIDCYMEKGFGWLFEAQVTCSSFVLSTGIDTICTRKVISHSTQSRDASIDLMISAIIRAIEYCHTHDTLTATAKQKEKEQTTDVHESNAVSIDGLESQLKERVVAVFGSARAAFDAHSTNGAMGKRELKKLIKRILPSLKQGKAKRLRKILPERMSSLDFCSFIGGPEDTATNKEKVKDEKCKEPDSSGLAPLPPEVPEVCVSV